MLYLYQMTHAILQILPLLLIFLIGFALKKAKMLSSDDGSVLLKLIFFAGVPALIFVSILKVKIDASLIWLCFFPFVITLITLGVIYLLRRSLLKKINTKTFGALVAGAVVMNTGFLLPFVEHLYGAEGLARLAVIDAFNALVTFGLVYAVIVRIGSDRPDKKFILKKLLIAPPIWALCIAIALKFLDVSPPTVVMDTLGTVAKLVGPVILIALGLKFSLKIKEPKLLLIPLVLRFGLGALIGLAFVKLLHLEGLTAQIALFASIAPTGFNSITFSELERLDVEFAASQVSIALIFALLASPFIVQLLTHF